MRLFLLPALGADERIFSFLGKLPIELVLPRLLSPHSEDTMETFAYRMAEVLELDEKDMIGGVSFGGMVAAEIARQRPLKSLILISSGLSSRSVDPLAQRLGRLACNLPIRMMRSILGSYKTFKKVFGNEHPQLYQLVRQMLADSPDALLLHGGRLSLNYHSELPLRCPVFAIHGEKDTMMFPVEVENCHMVSGAGQGMVVTHPEEVTRFLLGTVFAN
jgi:pimeloyl-ACP methyl ester carboxylesterase